MVYRWMYQVTEHLVFKYAVNISLDNHSADKIVFPARPVLELNQFIYTQTIWQRVWYYMHISYFPVYGQNKSLLTSTVLKLKLHYQNFILDYFASEAFKNPYCVILHQKTCIGKTVHRKLIYNTLTGNNILHFICHQLSITFTIYWEVWFLYNDEGKHIVCASCL